MDCSRLRRGPAGKTPEAARGPDRRPERGAAGTAPRHLAPRTPARKPTRLGKSVQVAQGLAGSAPGEEVTGAHREAVAAPRRAPVGAPQREGADPPAGDCAESPACSRARGLRWDLRRGRGEARQGWGAREAQLGPVPSHRAAVAAAARLPPPAARPPAQHCFFFPDAEAAALFRAG